MLRKRSVRGALAVAAALALVLLPQAQALGTVYGPYYLVQRTSSRCLDNPDSSPNNVTMIIFSCLYGNNQMWRNDTTPGANKWWITNVASSKCLTVYGASKENNIPVIQYDCNLGANEIWYYDYQGYQVYVETPDPPPNYQLARAYKIRNANSGKCLTVKNTGTANGSTLVQFTCSSPGNNIWLQGETG
jgi:hypothetical protein